MNKKLEIKQGRLRLYLAAEKAILSGQSYKMEGVELTRANLKEVQSMILRLEGEITKLSRARRARLRFVVPKDGW